MPRVAGRLAGAPRLSPGAGRWSPSRARGTCSACAPGARRRRSRRSSWRETSSSVRAPIRSSSACCRRSLSVSSTSRASPGRSRARRNEAVPESRRLAARGDRRSPRPGGAARARGRARRRSRGGSSALLFFNPSLRTLASMQAAMAKLGGTSYVVTPGAGSWKLETARWRRDGRRRLGACARGDSGARRLRRRPRCARFRLAGPISRPISPTRTSARWPPLSAKPLINLESAIDHPCQALADWKTLDDLAVPRDGKLVLSWANHPKALPLAVPAAVLRMAALRGMEVTVLRARRPTPCRRRSSPRPVRSRPTAAAASARPTIAPRRSRARRPLREVVGVVGHYGDAGDRDRAPVRCSPRGASTESWFDNAPGARFMHCLPVRRNVVVADAVLDSPRSVVVEQAHNRLWAQMAVLHRLLAGAAPTCVQPGSKRSREEKR